MENSVFLKRVVFNNSKVNAFNFYAITLVLIAVVASIYYYIDNLAPLPYLPIVSQGLMLFIALIGLGMFFVQKKRLQKTKGDDAYRIAFFRYHVTFIPIIYVSALHPIFISAEQGYYAIPNYMYLRYVFAAYFLLSGIILHIRTRKLFGLDNLFMYYVYHPTESVMVKSIIHSILRHPIYSAMSRIALGLALFNGNLTAVIIALLLTCNQIAWLAFYEEPDLVERFGEGYKKFKREVPALYVKPSKWIVFIKFLIGIEK